MHLKYFVGGMICLAALATTNSFGDVRTVTSSGQVLKRTREFEDDLRSVGVKGYLDCSLTILVADAPRDPSYGAICKLTTDKKTRPLMLCDDTMIGKLTVKFSGFAATERELTEFTRANCPNGG